MPDVNEVIMDEIISEQKSHAADAAPPPTKEERKQELNFVMEKLRHLENQQYSGAAPLTPKAALLDLSDLKAKYPEAEFRFVNVSSPDGAIRRQTTGWTRLPESEGGRMVGPELAVFFTSKGNRAAQVESMNKLHKARLEAHKAEVERAAEKIAKELRDVHGIRIDASQLLISE